MQRSCARDARWFNAWFIYSLCFSSFHLSSCLSIANNGRTSKILRFHLFVSWLSSATWFWNNAQKNFQYLACCETKLHTLKLLSEHPMTHITYYQVCGDCSYRTIQHLCHRNKNLHLSAMGDQSYKNVNKRLNENAVSSTTPCLMPSQREEKEKLRQPVTCRFSASQTGTWYRSSTSNLLRIAANTAGTVQKRTMR